MATLSIKINTEGKILIAPQGDISPQDWNTVVSWWDREFSFSTSKKIVEVSAADFSQRKYWLRENWTSLGHKVELENGVVDSVKNSEKLATDFTTLSQQEDPFFSQIAETVFKEMQSIDVPSGDRDAKNGTSTVYFPLRATWRLTRY